MAEPPSPITVERLLAVTDELLRAVQSSGAVPGPLVGLYAGTVRDRVRREPEQALRLLRALAGVVERHRDLVR